MQVANGNTLVRVLYALESTPGGTRLRNYVLKNFRVVRERPKKISDILLNEMQWIKKMQKGNPGNLHGRLSIHAPSMAIVTLTGGHEGMAIYVQLVEQVHGGCEVQVQALVGE